MKDGPMKNRPTRSAGSGHDTADMPEIRDWSGAKRGLFYRPIKRQLTLRLDADVVAWFRGQAKDGSGYQTRINRALRDHIAKRRRKSA
ncbi:MAG: BrnA antitoxin family protein [Alphaproteobacteria bacterium]|nr:BrnA antitoxin family protein [Alphaproteobacteria bacterium]